jgi:hypothetical protein
MKGLELMYEDHEDGGSDDDRVDDVDDNDSEEDPLDVLDEGDRSQLLENTVAVRTTLNKVCAVISFFLSIYSHLISLDSKTIFCNYPLNNYCPSCMA